MSERPIVTGESGLAEATLRIRHVSRRAVIEEALQKAFLRLFDIYGGGRFDVSGADCKRGKP
jgi:hypothetical protein